MRTPSTRRLVEQARVVRMGIPVPTPVARPAVQALRRRHGLQGRTVVLFIGRLVPVKGLELLLRACAGLEGLTLLGRIKVEINTSNQTVNKVFNAPGGEQYDLYN